MQRLRFLKAMLVAALLLLPMSVFAQAGATYSTGFQIQNLSPTDQASVKIEFFDSASGQKFEIPRTIAPNASIFVLSGDYPTGFTKGSVVLTSNVPVAAVTNIIGKDADNSQQFASYNGFSIGNETLNVPLILANVPDPSGSLDTWFSVQNAGSTTATVNVTYYGPNNQTVTEAPQQIAPGAAFIYDQSTNDQLASGTNFFVGSAVINGGGVPLVASVQQKTGASLLSYDAFVPTQSSTEVKVPLVMANNFGAFTGIQVQNTAASGTTNITVDFAPNTAVTPEPGKTLCAGDPPSQTVENVGPRASATFLQNSSNLGQAYWANCTYVGAATISGTNGAPLVAIVNQVGPSVASAYEGFNPGSTNATIKLPAAQANNFGIFSGVQVQNTGAAPAQVTLTYSANSAQQAGGPGLTICPTPTARTVTVQPGASKTFLQTADPNNPTAPYDPASVYDNQFNGCTYIGSVTVTGGTGATLAAIVNQLVPGFEEILTTYNGFNQ